jgi:hypothetical protein
LGQQDDHDRADCRTRRVDASNGVIEVDEDQNERTLAPGEVIKLRPGVAYGKKLCFKRGAE